QQRAVSIPPDATKPVMVSDIFLPISLVNKAGATLLSLNTLAVVISPVADILTNQGSQPITFNTNAFENLVADCVNLSSQTLFSAVYDGKNSALRDRWNSLIRLVAAGAVLHDQVIEDAKLVDDIGKAAALIICVDGVQRLSKAFPGKLAPVNLTVKQ